MSAFAVTPGYAISGLLVGLLIGQTGVGGGSLMTPILVLFFGIHPGTAVGTDLLYAALTKTAGTAVHGLNETVDWGIVRRLALGSLPGTMLTLLVLAHFNLGGTQNDALTLILGVMLLLAAVSLMLRNRILATIGPAVDRMSPERRAVWTIGTGLLLGVLVTLSSIGAGALGVTALLLLYPKAPMARIIGTDIAHAVPLTLLGGLGHWYLGSVDVKLLLSLLTGSVPGIIVGSWLASRMPDAVLRPVLAVTLAVVGARIVL